METAHQLLAARCERHAADGATAQRARGTKPVQGHSSKRGRRPNPDLQRSIATDRGITGGNESCARGSNQAEDPERLRCFLAVLYPEASAGFPGDRHQPRKHHRPKTCAAIRQGFSDLCPLGSFGGWESVEPRRNQFGGPKTDQHQREDALPGFLADGDGGTGLRRGRSEPAGGSLQHRRGCAQGGAREKSSAEKSKPVLLHPLHRL